MKLLSLVWTAVAVTVASAQDDFTPCGSPDPPQYLHRIFDEGTLGPSPNVAGNLTIDTYIHVVTTQQNQGNYTQSEIDDQVRLTSMLPLLQMDES